MDVPVTEFPFVADLPKREVSKLRTLWEDFKALKPIVEKRGALVTPQAACDLLGVSRQRVLELIDQGRFTPIRFHGRVLVAEDDIVAFAESERKNGRPCGPSTMAEAAKAALQAGRNHLKNSSK